MNQITPFNFKNKNVRVIQKDGKPWFVAKDLCLILGIKNVSDALDRLDLDEKGIAKGDTLGGSQNMATVSESGLYALVLRSNKPEAKMFRRWVTNEVIPQIRQTGAYQKQLTRKEALVLALRQEEELERLNGTLTIIEPKNQFGELSKNGLPKTGIRRAAFVARASRMFDAVRFIELSDQMELQLSECK